VASINLRVQLAGKCWRHINITDKGPPPACEYIIKTHANTASTMAALQWPIYISTDTILYKYIGHRVRCWESFRCATALRRKLTFPTTAFLLENALNCAAHRYIFKFTA